MPAAPWATPSTASSRSPTATAPACSTTCEVPGLPATNNDLEQFFGAQRHHERRTTGRKVASPSLVVRGSVRVLAATLTRLAPISAQDLAAVDLVKWRETRARLKQRHHARVLRSRFRRNPAAYLAALEQRAFQQLALPP